MATLLDRVPIRPRAIERAASATPTRHAGRSLDELTDREIGYVAVGVIVGLALLIVTVLVAIVIYSLSWGYTIEL